MTTIAFELVFRFVRLLVGTLLIAFVLFRGAMVVSGWSSDTGVPTIFGKEVFVVRSGSMSPAIKTGDAVLISTSNEDLSIELAVGDVVTFHPSSNRSLLISHRIVDTVTNEDGEQLYVTKGDANASRDSELVSSDRIVGRVEARLPQIGRLLVASQGIGLMALFAAAFVLAHVSVVLGRSARNLTRETLPAEGPPMKGMQHENI